MPFTVADSAAHSYFGVPIAAGRSGRPPFLSSMSSAFASVTDVQS
jgi:hypothetical protein